MKHIFDLKAGQSESYPVQAEYVSYSTGAGEIEISLLMDDDSTQLHTLDVLDTINTTRQGFREITIKNNTALDGEFTLKFGLGAMSQAKAGQVVEVRRIAEAVQAQITNQVDIRQITEKLNAEITNQVDIRPITEKLSTEEKAASSITVSEIVFSAGESFIIPANENRRDISIFSDQENTGLLKVAGTPLNARDFLTINHFVGAVPCEAVAAGKISITQVNK